jgi:toxin ParE1/3/4
MIVRRTEAALANLGQIEAYVAQSSPQNAETLIERILDRSAVLSDQPRIGPIVSEYQEESLRELLEKPYRVIYRLYTDSADVVAVVHSARRLQSVFQ